MTVSDKIPIISMVIAAGSVIFSIISYRDNKALATEGFNKSYRPYIFAQNYSYIANGILHLQENIVLLKIINQPAFLREVSIKYYQRDVNNHETLIFTQPQVKTLTLYPADAQQFTLTVADSIISRQIALNIRPAMIVRKIYITYSWLDKSDKIYFFKSESIFNTTHISWDNISQEAN